MGLTLLATLVGSLAPHFSARATPQSNPNWRSHLATLPAPSSWQVINVPGESIHARPIQLWATYYHLYRATTIPDGIPLLDKVGNPLPATLSLKDWCHSALNGTTQITDQFGQTTVYHYSGRGDTPGADCSSFFSSLSADVKDKVSRVRFRPVEAPYGYGAKGLPMVPYRTIAVDRDTIPFGSVVYIPAARGTIVTLPSGEQVVHDGFFYAADTGSALRGGHIDVYVGTAEKNPFAFVTSSPSGSFTAYIVEEPGISNLLLAMHQRSFP